MLPLHFQSGGVAREHYKPAAWFEDFDSGSMPPGWLAASGLPLTTFTDTWFLPANISFSASKAIISIRQQASNGKNYTSGQLLTRGRRSVFYGRLDVRAKVPFGSGLWTELWTNPQYQIYGPWPGSGEVDLFENPGPGGGFTNQQQSVNLHYGPTVDTTPSAPLQFGLGYDVSAAFHTYSLIWQPGSFQWLTDDVVLKTVSTWNPPSGKSLPAPFDSPHYLMLDCVVGAAGSWSGAPSGTTFPQTLEIDWVRYTP